MSVQQKIYRILTNAGYYYATPPSTGKWGRFSEDVRRAWLFCELHASQNMPWMIDTGLQPRLILTDKMYCNQCDVNKRKQP